ncbi:MAG: hypothetical protein A2Y07_01310 [Planctomycetes bacterium GWF2_50_10]|nr:MAG: hypothetical protein A2Y07_01310 [Planctomycetes bacterium GWF2_50_10]
MAITVAHEPSFRLVGRVAYETGLGQQSDRKEKMARQEAQAAAQSAQIEAQKQRDAQLHKYDMEKFEAQGEQARENVQFQSELNKDQAIELDKSRYTVSQQRQIEDLYSKIDWIDQQAWKPEEKEQAKKQLQWQYATGQSKSPWAVESPRELAQRSTFVDPDSGHRIFVNPNTGEVKDLDEGESKAHKQLVFKTFNDLIKTPKSLEDSTPKYSPQQAFEISNQIGMMTYPQFYPDITKRNKTIRSIMANPQEFLSTMAQDLMKPNEFGVPDAQLDPNIAADIKAMQTLIELGDEKRLGMALEQMGIIKPLPKFDWISGM